MISIEDELKQTLTSLSELSNLKTGEEEAGAYDETQARAMQLLCASTPLLSALKRVNRRIYTDLYEQKTRVAEERAKVDTARLGLQNLKYEESMLELEVKICQEFQSIYQTIQLHPLEEFHSLRAQLTPTTKQSLVQKEEDENGDEESWMRDEHKLMLARLRFELTERKRLEQEKQRLHQDKTEVAKDNKDKKVKLEQAEKQLKDLLAAAQAVQEKFESF